MSDKELSQLLHQVHSELEDTEKVSEEERALLAQLMSDIKGHIGPTDEQHQGLGDRLDEAVGQFNQSHPTLAFALRRMMDALSKMGI
ncbi:MAG: DUF4404 family protein [Gammaproteobacteria bacterium]|nr:DUF4404 family protein [Gammaproteobacteria bacterium]NNF62028.1 DUF4404 family protein [Gammaproteobacteria bacterium]NNM19894.1 DUF4404 family protein [Gammaproteobacteria bacterium]